ncbi:antitoxin [Yinghuangia soli]|uniref:Antitoxin n=1 Tax=Yinghuangia soli TaxID=2908204 RepID=A0AA41QA86_9ACTN|nr:antitoxin [Yinghuangia soli]MCF2533067.1 antitoxin [Yinghuangia soli]
MGLLDTIKEKLAPHSDKAEQAVDKATDMIDEKTGGKYSGQLDAGAEKAKDTLGINNDEAAPEAPAEAAPEAPAAEAPAEAPPAEENPPA